MPEDNFSLDRSSSANLQFTGENASILYGKFEPSNQTPAMIRLAMKIGFKSRAQATAALLMLAALAFGLSIYFFATGGTPKPTQLPAGLAVPPNVAGGAAFELRRYAA
jgi:hypothetical protein